MDQDKRQQLEERKKQSKSAEGDRMDAEADQQFQTPVDKLEEYLDEVHDGDRSRSVSFYDPAMAAILGYLEEDDERLEDIVTAAQAHLGRDVDPDEADRAELIRLVLRTGFNELDADLLEETGEANQNRINRDAKQI